MAVRRALRLSLRARETATVMLDIERGRGVSRSLDACRGVWPRVHRDEGT
ncbi:MAG TPA: hypothetical protein VFI25_19085 [Planctomycetota bacterium]|nr:hypothetical protein [Planctomycetota bacterium]